MKSFARALALSAATIASIAALHGTVQAATPPVVTVAQGAVSGSLQDNVRRYLGIRFATAGRWQAPQAAPAWSGTLDGTKFGSSCPQKGSMLSADSKNEDCLFLNVYVPDDIGGARLPVMFWIHGGGFAQGTASDYDLSILARKTRTVVVSTNYRLGVFGFYALPGVRAETGNLNFGLQDQQAALRWVQSNIGQFGGDAKRVTIFGESAGGTSICLHMVSPQSAGLFHRAISESGPCTVLTASSPAAFAAASSKLAQDLGCPDGPNQLACMRAKPVADLNEATAWDQNILSTGPNWTPVVDGVSLPDNPGKLVQQGRFARVPAIFGSNHDEGRLFVAVSFHLTNLLPVSAAQFAQAVAFESKGDTNVQAQLTGAYTTARYGTRDKALAALITDEKFSCNVNNDVGVLSNFVPTWSYEFNAVVPGAQLDPYMAMGAFHGAEMRYLFQNKIPGLPIALPLSTQQQALADQMGQYWGNFAATGNPNGTGLPTWQRYNRLTTPVQNLAVGAVAPQAAGAFAADHQCGMWNGIKAAQAAAR